MKTSGRSANASANHRARWRARQRARWRTAQHFRAEYDRHLDGQTGGTRTPTDTEQARAMQAVCTAHPRTYRRYYREQLADETMIPLRRGREPVFPHGTPQAWHRHAQRHEERCAECRAWWEAEHAAACLICGKRFVAPGRRYCSKACYRLRLYLRYWAKKTDRKYRPQERPWERANTANRLAEQAGVDLSELVGRWRAS